jgi:anti-sigma28 factor (negative regulator of flagellin synthesis)
MRSSEVRKALGITARDFSAVASSANHVARRQRVEELRSLVAEGRYQVNPRKLALKILVKAFTNRNPRNFL